MRAAKRETDSGDDGDDDYDGGGGSASNVGADIPDSSRGGSRAVVFAATTGEKLIIGLKLLFLFYLRCPRWISSHQVPSI